MESSSNAKLAAIRSVYDLQVVATELHGLVHLGILFGRNPGIGCRFDREADKPHKPHHGT